jgi:indole-3-glycerol phosphate synthase
MNILTKIVERKYETLKSLKGTITLSDFKSRIRDLKETEDFKKAIKRTDSGLRLIAEVKKASPSRGMIRKDFDHIKIAKIYDSRSVDAISVITEEYFFQGDLRFIRDIKDITPKPILRKDFIIDEYQIYESRASLADAILLIGAILEKNQAVEYLHIARELGLHVLFEIHDEYDLEKAIDVGAEIIGINNRDLKTLKIDISTTIRLKKDIPSDRIIVSESGIEKRDDVVMLQNEGIDAILVGTSLMESSDIGKKIDELMGG